ncbi:RNA polymerase II degradation factor 1 [Drosophila obscura]|uniref:RNA polymerase II degradation factor 1 n=1 Tax=Drosophila obscura TaxID=7282 RepID=UPI001BB24E69|nr:RNA polymerase II degradation factor 1 [Drosophila obscura]
MSLKYLLIASALLIGVCLGDVSEISDQKIDLPFNDLLPPLLDESTTSSTTSTSTTTSTTTTVAPPPPTAAITKPTKKSYYQKPAPLNKEDKSKPSSGKQAIQLLSLDLLPPFEDEAEPEESKPQEVAKVVAVSEPKPVAKLAPAFPRAVPRPQHVAKVAPQQAALKPQYARIASPAIHPTQTSIGGGGGYTSRFSNYFLTSTPRPRRGPLPTLTPFPRHIKK